MVLDARDDVYGLAMCVLLPMTATTHLPWKEWESLNSFDSFESASNALTSL